MKPKISQKAHKMFTRIVGEAIEIFIHPTASVHTEQLPGPHLVFKPFPLITTLHRILTPTARPTRFTSPPSLEDGTPINV
jgi:hypothetical protein